MEMRLLTGFRSEHAGERLELSEEILRSARAESEKECDRERFGGEAYL